ncbi:MAG: hypothetical protein Q4G21_07295 [Dermabacter sp.]|nr:hypothetical protein [Dermabacter sp.]
MAKKKASLETMKDEALRRQDNLASDIDELVDRVNPVNAVKRWGNEAKDIATGFFVADDGRVKPAPAIGVAGGVIGVLAVVAGLALLASRTSSSPR